MSFNAVLRRLVRPGARPSRPGCRPTSCSSTTGADMIMLADEGILEPEVGPAELQGRRVPQSVVVFALRDGNPKHIKGWNDLLKPGVEIITPNPFTAGVAKWNILAAYSAQRPSARPTQQAQTFVKKLFDPRRRAGLVGQNATNTFLSGKGDVLLTFESEAINARLAGRDIQYVIPRQTMLIDVYTARHREQPEQGRSECVPPLPEVAAGAAGASRRTATARSTSGVARSSSAKQFPSRPGRDHDRRQADRRLARGRQEVVRPEQEHHGHDREVAWSVDLWHLASLKLRRSAGAEHARHPPGRGPARPSPSACDDVPGGHRRAADRGAGLVVDASAAATGFWDVVTSARGGRGAEAVARDGRARRAHERACSAR